jgi:hypothetical protein
MKLYFNGCSSTYGDELPSETREATTWAAQVAKHYNCDFFNAATSGGTNGRIVSHVIEHIDQFDKFYIQWTHASRFTLVDPANWYEVHFNGMLRHDRYKDRPQFLIFAKYYYTYWHNSLFEFKKWLEEIILLQTFFKYHNKPYLMVSTTNNYYDTYSAGTNTFIDKVGKLIDITNFDDQMLMAQHKKIQNLLGQIDFKFFIPPTTWNFHAAKHLPRGPNGHPLEEGHLLVAHYIIDYENKLALL